MKEMKSKFVKRLNDQEIILQFGPFPVTSPNPNVESFEEYHYLRSQKRIVYEKYETGILPKDVTLSTPNFRRFIQSPDKEIALRDISFIKVIFDCDKKKKKYSLTIIEFFDYKKINLSSTPMRKMIEILCSKDDYVNTKELVRKTGFKNIDTLRASKRRINAQIRKKFGTNKDFLEGDQGNGYHISKSFLVLKKS